MLLRYFGKIDVYTPFRVGFLALLLAALGQFLFHFTGLHAALAALLLVLLYLLSWTVFRDRWLRKSKAFRFLAFPVLVAYALAEVDPVRFLAVALALELNWHWAEYFRRSRNVFWILNNSALLGVLYAIYPAEAVFVALLSVFTWLTTAQLAPRSFLQWVFSLLLSAISASSLAVLFGFSQTVLGLPNFEKPSVPLLWWLFPGVVFLVTLYQSSLSFRRANNLNKARSLIASFWVVASLVSGAFLGLDAPYAALVLGLSYQVANAWHYIQRRRYLVEALIWLSVAFAVASALNFVVL